MKKVCIITLGCKVNQYESGQIAQKYHDMGYYVSHSIQDNADVYVVNTCAVTSFAEKKSRYQVSRIKRLNPNAEIIVCGCAGDRSLNNSLTCFSQQNRSRAFVKVQDGCNNFCSYCIVPYLRGRSKSREISEIVAEIKHVAKPIVLTGIDLSDYGAKKYGRGEGLAELCKAVDLCGFPFELSSIEIGIISQNFLQILSDCKNIIPKFHLPLQSASDKVLIEMNRKYTAKQFSDGIAQIRNFFPNAVISADVIVGFPTETEKDFLQTLEFIKVNKFAHVHAFPYSKREGTEAAKLPELQPSIITERMKRIFSR